MNRIILIATLFFALCCADDDYQCNQNASFQRCAEPCPKTCAEDILRDNDAKCEEHDCKPGCDCNAGFVLNELSDCISIEDCQKKCPPNSHFANNPCNKFCAHMFNESCAAATKGNCECDQGHFLNSDGQCVTVFECNAEEVVCPANASFYTCASSCPITCSNMFTLQICNMMCNVKCDCLPGFVLNKDNVCIAAKDCTREDMICSGGKVYDECGNSVERTCDNLYSPLQCYRDCIPGCYCPGGHIFDPETASCVCPHQCENSLENRACRNIDPNMKYYDCYQGPARTCYCPEESLEGDCSQGCYCAEGMVLNDENKCVDVDECPT